MQKGQQEQKCEGLGWAGLSNNHKIRDLLCKGTVQKPEHNPYTADIKTQLGNPVFVKYLKRGAHW